VSSVPRVTAARARTGVRLAGGALLMVLFGGSYAGAAGPAGSSGIAGGTPAGAEAAVDSARVYRLGEIIVNADRPSPEMRASTDAYSAVDLERLPVSTARDVLKGTPGVIVSTGQKDEAGIAMRGFGPRRVAIQVDGRPMNLPYYGNFDLSSISSDKLDGILVARGPASVTFGANAMGGVVNFVTARGRDRLGTRVRLSAGNRDTGEVQLTHGLARGAWDLFLSARAAGSDGATLPSGFRPLRGAGREDGGLRDNSDYAAWDLFGKLGYNPDFRTDIALSGGYQTQEKGLPAAVDEERYWRYSDWRRYFADLTLRRQLSPDLQLEAKGYGDVFVNTLVDYEDATYDPSAVFYDSTHDTWDAGGIVSLERAWSPEHRGTYGCTLREDQIRKRMNPTDPWLYHHQVTGSVYAQHVARLSRRFTGSLGLADDFAAYNHLRTVDHVPGGTAGLAATVSERWTVTGSAGQSSRFPTLSQLWGSQSGNRNLRAEVARRCEAGVDGRPVPAVQTEGVVFWNDLRDLIDRDLRRGGRYENIRSARTWGAETTGALRLSDRAELQLSYTYTRSRNRDTDQPLDLVPRHKADGRLVLQTHGGDTQWALLVTRAGSRYDDEALTADRTLPAYTTADCRITTRLARFLAVSLDIRNLGDACYEEEVMFPAPGRSVLFTALLDF